MRWQIARKCRLSNRRLISVRWCGVLPLAPLADNQLGFGVKSELSQLCIVEELVARELSRLCPCTESVTIVEKDRY